MNIPVPPDLDLEGVEEGQPFDLPVTFVLTGGELSIQAIAGVPVDAPAPDEGEEQAPADDASFMEAMEQQMR